MKNLRFLRSASIVLLVTCFCLAGCRSDDGEDDDPKESKSNLCKNLNEACSGTGTDPIPDCEDSKQTAEANGCGTEYNNWAQCITDNFCDPASCQDQESAYNECMNGSGDDSSDADDTTQMDADNPDTDQGMDAADSSSGETEETSDGMSGNNLCTSLSNACAGTGANPISDCQQSKQTASQNGCGTKYDKWVQCIVDMNCDPASCQTEESAYKNCGSGSGNGDDICQSLDNACSGTGTDPAPSCNTSLKDAQDNGCGSEYTSWLQCIVDVNCDPASCQDKKATYDNCSGS